MGAISKIEWTDASWSPIRARNLQTGKVGWHCEHVTTGCEFCYAEGLNKRLGTGLPFKPGHRKEVEIFLDEKMLTAPLRWKKPRMIFVCSMTDLFADFVKDDWINRIFNIMADCQRHTFQVLTKRPARMLKYSVGLPPLPNVWLGVSCERQQEADERIPLLLQTPAAIRFVSAEPLLGPIDLTHITRGDRWFDAFASPDHCIDWLICGGESGPHARPMHPQWARDLRDQCNGAGVSFFFKQWGEFMPVGQHLPGYGKIHGATAINPGRMRLHYAGTPRQEPTYAFAERGVGFASTPDGRLTFRVGKKTAGRLLDGVEHNEMPR